MSISVGENRIRQTRFLEEFEAPLSDALGASFDIGPLSWLNDLRELRDAESGELFPVPRTPEEVLQAQREGRRPTDRQAPSTPIVQAEEARKRIKDEGLDLTVPDEGIREGALNLLMERKRAERKRQDILNRAPRGFVPGSLMVGTALATSLLDPLNVASAFIPAVGPTRYSMMLARAAGPLGRAGVRAGVGAVEGAVGAAVIEPLILTSAHRLQADYDMADSLLNVAFGTVLGGGLHVGAGFVGDLANPAQWRTARATEAMPQILERVAPGTREAALRTAVAQAAEGRVIDIEPLIRMDPATRRQELRSGAATVEPGRPLIKAPEELTPIWQTTLALRDRLQALLPDANITIQPGGSRAGQSIYLTASLPSETRQIRLPIRISDHSTGPIRARDYVMHIKHTGLTDADISRLESLAARALDERRTAPTVAQNLEAQLVRARAKIDGIPKSVAGRATTNTSEARQSVAHLTRLLEAEKKKTAEGSVRSGMPEQSPRQEQLTQGGRAMTPQDLDVVKAAAARSQRPESTRLADFLASQDAEAKFQEVTKPDELEAIEADLADTMQQVQDTARALEAEDRVKAALEPFDELIATAESYGKAVRAAALCQLRRG